MDKTNITKITIAIAMYKRDVVTETRAAEIAEITLDQFLDLAENANEDDWFDITEIDLQTKDYLSYQEQVAYREYLKVFRDNQNILDTARREGQFRSFKEVIMRNPNEFLDIFKTLDDKTIAKNFNLHILVIERLRKELF